MSPQTNCGIPWTNNMIYHIRLGSWVRDNILCNMVPQILVIILSIIYIYIILIPCSEWSWWFIGLFCHQCVSFCLSICLPVLLITLLWPDDIIWNGQDIKKHHSTWSVILQNVKSDSFWQWQNSVSDTVSGTTALTWACNPIGQLVLLESMVVVNRCWQGIRFVLNGVTQSVLVINENANSGI